MSLARIEAWLRAEAGLEPAALGAGTLGRVAQARAVELGLGSVGDLAALLARDPAEGRRVVDRLLVHETWFFRYPASFDVVARAATARRARAPGPFRVLSAPCSTGEEPASIAIALLDAGLPPGDVRIDAVDVSGAALARAREGRYGRTAFRRVDPRGFPGHLEPDGDGWRLQPRTLGTIRYEAGDLLDEAWAPRAAGYDAIFCRNLLIYLTTAARRRVLDRVGRLLAPDGILFLGHAEVACVWSEGLRPLEPPAAFACVRRDVAPPPRSVARPSPAHRRAPPLAAPARAVPAAPPPTEAPLARARRLADGGRLDEALSVLAAEATGDRLSADHHHLVAVIHRAAGRVGDAEQAVRRALYVDPAHEGALVQAALAAEARGDLAGAQRLWARAERARRDPTGAGGMHGAGEGAR